MHSIAQWIVSQVCTRGKLLQKEIISEFQLSGKAQIWTADWQIIEILIFYQI